MKLYIVSGRSGAGKSVALRVLEDLGFYCVDNLPVSLLSSFVENAVGEQTQLAVSVDIRNLPKKSEEFPAIVSNLKRRIDLEVISIFLDADDATLIRRYAETRRLHPLAKNRLTLEDAIKAEHAILDPIAGLSDVRVDTSMLTIHELSEVITTLVLGKKEKNISIIFESFGFKNGLAKDADFIFDARFLPNPYWERELRPLTGLDEDVIRFFQNYPEITLYIQQIDAILLHWLPYIERSNRSYLTVGIGCTGGQHRSVYIVEQLAARFRNRGKNVTVKHNSLKLIEHKGK